MSTAAQRRAWNDAMRSAGAVLPPSASVSGGIAGGSSIRRGRNKRREKARNSSGGRGGGGDGSRTGGSSSLEEREYQVAQHMDMLEGVVDKFDEDADDDEYDEFAELDDNDGDEYEGKAKKKRKGAGGTSKKKAASASSSSSSVPKYLKARSLASILIEEASRSDSMAKQYVGANVRRLGSGMTSTRRVVDAGGGSKSFMMTIIKPYPHRKFCPVTGLVGEYTEPRTGIPYATLSALEQIRERPPPWMSTNNSGSANYWEAVKSLQNH